ncbi:MAG: hypothetical protein BGN95_03810 [Sphingomonas sp. 66-10]|uniref:DUF6441 family protein n=1 Tax=Sphingomonas sp. 66-10 TaxID=1895848 RepID=UPI00092A0F06|nr:DUF6441 family protein [Sphingomonas sp. 66-10]OJU22703.1 MAG: hypothetical protein BGN95_03810 [Sphingomonas sp. 66-10]
MADGVILTVDGRSIDKASDSIIRTYLSAATRSVAGTTRGLEKKLERATEQAAGGKLWRAWQSSAYPSSGPARNPAGTIWLKGGARTRGAVRFWTEPGTIRGSRGQYLAIPLPAAGSRGRARDLTPGEWERRTGIRLRFVYRPGRASLLVADNSVLGSKGVARGNTARRIAAGRMSATVPIFVLIPLLKFRNAFSLAPMINASEGELARAFLAEVAAAR